MKIKPGHIFIGAMFTLAAAGGATAGYAELQKGSTLAADYAQAADCKSAADTSCPPDHRVSFVKADANNQIIGGSAIAAGIAVWMGLMGVAAMSDSADEEKEEKKSRAKSRKPQANA